MDFGIWWGGVCWPQSPMDIEYWLYGTQILHPHYVERFERGVLYSAMRNVVRAQTHLLTEWVLAAAVTEFWCQKIHPIMLSSKGGTVLPNLCPLVLGSTKRRNLNPNSVTGSKDNCHNGQIEVLVTPVSSERRRWSCNVDGCQTPAS